MLPIFSAIVGGVGSPLGAIAGGFVIAFSELTITFAYKKCCSLLPEGMAPTGLMQLLSTDYKIALFVILVIVLLIRPTGCLEGKRVIRENTRKPLLFAAMALLLIIVGIFQSWNLAFAVLDLS